MYKKKPENSQNTGKNKTLNLVKAIYIGKSWRQGM